MMRAAVAFIAGLLFAAGLGLSGMTDAGVVVGFLDVLGGWQPALLLVMVGGISVRAAAWWLGPRAEAPWFGDRFVGPVATAIDARLLSGAVLFGLGWGLGGYCPGPGVVSLATGTPEAFLFVGSMLAGMVLQGVWDRATVVETEVGTQGLVRQGADCG